MRGTKLLERDVVDDIICRSQPCSLSHFKIYFILMKNCRRAKTTENIRIL